MQGGHDLQRHTFNVLKSSKVLKFTSVPSGPCFSLELHLCSLLLVFSVYPVVKISLPAFWSTLALLPGGHFQKGPISVHLGVNAI